MHTVLLMTLTLLVILVVLVMPTLLLMTLILLVMLVVLAMHTVLLAMQHAGGSLDLFALGNFLFCFTGAVYCAPFNAILPEIVPASQRSFAGEVSHAGSSCTRPAHAPSSPRLPGARSSAP